MKTKIMLLSTIAVVIVLIMTINIGCPSVDRDLLRYMFYDNFPIEYKIISKSESMLFQNLFRKNKCSYEIKITRKDHKALYDDIKNKNYWRRIHPEGDMNPCLFFKNNPDCDENELQSKKIIRGMDVICYARYRPSSPILLLNCNDI
jgi:hypothetical protein